jgi:hypothetical protein
MKLFEITRPFSLLDARQRLEQAGYFILDHGSYAEVYSNRKNPYVLKLFGTHDRAYLSFLKLIQSYRNIHFPRIIGKPMRVNDLYWGIRLEPLTDIESKWEDYAVWVLENIYHYIVSANRHPNSTDAAYIDALDFLEQEPTMKEAVDLISTLYPQYLLDLKLNNIMMRGRTMVFIDPVKNPYLS